MYAGRSRFLSDCFHKIAKRIMKYCADNRIDTLIIGRNNGLKQHSRMDHNNNRDFHNVPTEKLYLYLSYRCRRARIKYVETEESLEYDLLEFKDFYPPYKKDAA